MRLPESSGGLPLRHVKESLKWPQLVKAGQSLIIRWVPFKAGLHRPHMAPLRSLKPYVRYNQYYPNNLWTGVPYLLGTILRSILNCQRDPMFIAKGLLIRLIRLILTVAHMRLMWTTQMALYITGAP